MSKHLKRLNAPKSLKIRRKERKFTVKPSPGPHPVKKSISLALVVREHLKLADTLREAKRIISNGEIIIDGEVKKDYKFPCGLMDVISVPHMKKHFRVLFNRRGQLVLVPIENKQAEWKLCRIENKTTLKGKKTQLNFHDGNNKIVKKDEYSTGDVLKIILKDKKIDDVYKFDKGSVSMIIGGSHIGEIADIKDIQIVESSRANLTTMKGENEFLTLQKYVFPIGTKKPTISLPEVKIQ